jgi:hypothetical protein
MTVFEIINVVLILLAIIATVVVIGRVRGTRLAVWLLVIWFIPAVGPIVALFKSREPVTPRA